MVATNGSTDAYLGEGPIWKAAVRDEIDIEWQLRRAYCQPAVTLLRKQPPVWIFYIKVRPSHSAKVQSNYCPIILHAGLGITLTLKKTNI